MSSLAKIMKNSGGNKDPKENMLDKVIQKVNLNGKKHDDGVHDEKMK